MSDDRYARVYFDRIAQDEKFDGIRNDRAKMGSWLLCLCEAEKAWPSPAFPLPESWVPAADFEDLARRGIIDVLDDGRYRFHGLDPERARRSAHGKLGADARWSAQSNAPSSPTSNAPSNAHASAVSNARRDETRLDETSKEARDDELTATFLELVHRNPSKPQAGVIRDYLDTFDVSGSERGREIMAGRPEDPIGALIDDLAAFRAQRRDEARREEEAAKRQHRAERREAARSEVAKAYFAAGEVA